VHLLLSYPCINHKHSHLTLPISMLQTATPPHSNKLASFIQQAHFPVKVSFINVSIMIFDSFLSIPQYGAFLLSVDNCRLWCHWAASSKNKTHRLNKFTVFMNCFDEFTFYMNPHIFENSICVFNEFIYSVFISYNK
jgi:hypothetical protein